MGTRESEAERRLCFESLILAVDRWERATEIADCAQASEKAVRFGAVGEALFWASCLDDLTGRPRENVSANRVHLLEGLRYARNRLTHDLVQTTTEHPGVILPARLPFRLVHYRWQDADKIPAPPRGQGSRDAGIPRAGYVAVWQGRHVDETLRALLEHLEESQ